MTMATKVGVAGMTLAALVLAAMPALADPITAGDQVFVRGGSSRFTYTGVGTGGAFDLYKWDGATNTATLMDFETFCLEVNERIGSSPSIPPENIYSVVDISDSARSGGVSGQTSPGLDPLSVQTKWVYHQYSLGTSSAAGWTGSLVQEVIWYLEGERVSGVSAAALAIANNAPSSFDFGIWSVQVLNLQTLSGGSAQDMIYMHSVPEPASLVLLGSGLLGLAAWRRKRQ